MYDFLLTSKEQALKKEVRQFVRDEITSEFLRKMDKDEITYPRDFVEKLADKGLRGIRFPKKYGGREMSWVAEVAATEEIGCLGMALGCAFVMQMMIPERLTSAAGCLGVWGALDLAVRYSNKRMAFGNTIRNYQAINFKIADSITQLDAARSLCYLAAKAVDEKYTNVRRIVSEAKRFTTETAWNIVNNAMQILGGIGYTDVYPISEMEFNAGFAAFFLPTHH